MAGIDLLNIDASVIYQFTIYLLTLIILSRWLIRPVTATLALRRERLAPADVRSGLEDSVKEKEEEYARVLQDVRGTQSRLRQEERVEAKADERSVIEKAQGLAAEKLQAGRQHIQETIQAAEKEVEQDIPKLAKALARTILGREL